MTAATGTPGDGQRRVPLSMSHIGLYVHDLPTMEDFYTRVLGFTVTDRGKVRKNNEDSFVAIQFDAQEVRYLGKVGEDTGEHNDFVFAVSDGMGGAMAGEFASRITIDIPAGDGPITVTGSAVPIQG